jgi:hypothetical protein
LLLGSLESLPISTPNCERYPENACDL